MKHLKCFESLIDDKEPEIGDYVICEAASHFYGTEFAKYIDGHIGVIENIYYFEYDQEYKCVVRYENTKRATFSLKNIKHWSKNKKDLEIYLDSKKYNL